MTKEEEYKDLLRKYAWEVYKLTNEKAMLLEAINGRDELIITLQRQIDVLNKIIEENEKKEDTTKTEA